MALIDEWVFPLQASVQSCFYRQVGPSGEKIYDQGQMTCHH